MTEDPFYDADWRTYIEFVRRQVGAVDFADLVYVRSHVVRDRSASPAPAYDPPLPPLFGAKEGQIAKASRGRDPLYLFAALQRQLGYPEVPRIEAEGRSDDEGAGNPCQGARTGNAPEAGRGGAARASRFERVHGQGNCLTRWRIKIR